MRLASGPPKQKGGKKRVSSELAYKGERPEGLPEGWVVDESMRLSGKLAGRKYKSLKIFLTVSMWSLS